MAFNPDWNYNLLEDNCHHWSSLVITGTTLSGLKKLFIILRISKYACRLVSVKHMKHMKQ